MRNILIAILCLCVGVFAESSVDSAKASRQKSAQKKALTTKINAESALDSAKINRQNRAKKQISTPKKSAESSKEAKSTTQKSAQKSAESKKAKKLGYRNVKITGISRQRSDKISFFVGASFGIDAISMQEIVAIDRSANTKKWLSGSASFGAKGGIISEEEWLGGRFYAEISYTKFPKFNVLNMGVDLDLLIKYYETASWKIGGFLGLGGGMNMAFVADSALKKEGEKSLIAVGWVNIGLVRFVYYHRTGIHSAELNAKISYLTPTIYSLKNVESGVTTSYKGSASGVVVSYIYQF